MDWISRVWFTVTGGVLMLLATALVVFGIYEAAGSVLSRERLLDVRLLTAIGYVVIAIAVFDVAKYLLEEEVVRERELRHVSEVRRSLTRFISTILIAVFLEGVVTVFKVSNENIALMVYPTLLLLAGVAMLVGLGLFQRLSAAVERDVGHEDDRDEEKSEG
jgi:hypothetical protein